jgi:hypothetical protein
MAMEMRMVVDRGRSRAGRAAGAVQQLPPAVRLRRRKSRAQRVSETFQALLPVARVGVVAVAAGVAIGVAYVARRRFFAAAAVVADIVEEAADAVEDAAEDLGEAARARSEGSGAD